MATTIENFFNQAVMKQFSRDFHFRVKQIVIEGASFSGEDDLIYARSAALPAREISNKNANYAGQNFNVAGSSSYPNSEAYTIEFYVDEQMDLRRKLEGASRAVFNNETTTGEYGMAGRDSYMILEVIDKELATVETIKLIGVGIRNVGEIDYQIADGTGEIKNFPCTFAYHFYEDFS
jgi:hypothetical protein